MAHLMLHILNQLTVNGLDASTVIIWKLEVFGVEPLIEGGHDGRRVIRVLQAQSVTQLMHRDQENIISFTQDKKMSQPIPALSSSFSSVSCLPPWSVVPVVHGSARSK